MNVYRQLCVWEGTVIDKNNANEFEKFFLKEVGVRVKYSEEVITNPTPFNEFKEPGGRNDVLFYIHVEDISIFATKRFIFGIKWWEDVVSYNNKAYLYTNEILAKYPTLW